MTYYRKFLKSGIASVALAAVIGLSGCTLEVDPLSYTETKVLPEADIPTYFKHQESVSRSMSVYHAIAHAIKYNTGRRIAALNSVLAHRDVTLATLQLLPSVSAGSTYTWENHHNPGGRSRDLSTGQITETGPLTETTPQRQITANIRASYNILDLGLSYINAQISSNQLLIAREQRRLAINQLVADVQQAFWPALTAYKIEAEFTDIEKRIGKAIEELRSEELQQDIPLRALNEERRLIQLRRQLTSTRAQLFRSRYNLNNLIGKPADSRFELHTGPYYIPVHGLNVEQLTSAAFNFRPEVRITALEKRVTEKQSLLALLRRFPGLNAFYEFNNSDNQFLVAQNTVNASIALSWNIVELFSIPEQLKRNEVSELLAQERQLAVGMSLLLQNRLSHVNYIQAVQDYGDVLRLNQVESRIESTVKAAAEGGLTATATPIDLLRARLNRVLSSLNRADSYGSVHRSAYEVQRSAGLDILPEAIAGLSINEMAEEIERQISTAMKMVRVSDRASLQLVRSQYEGLSISIERIVSLWENEKESQDPFLGAGFEADYAALHQKEKENKNLASLEEKAIGANYVVPAVTSNKNIGNAKLLSKIQDQSGGGLSERALQFWTLLNNDNRPSLNQQVPNDLNGQESIRPISGLLAPADAVNNGQEIESEADNYQRDSVSLLDR